MSWRTIRKTVVAEEKETADKTLLSKVSKDECQQVQLDFIDFEKTVIFKPAQQY